MCTYLMGGQGYLSHCAFAPHSRSRAAQQPHTPTPPQPHTSTPPQPHSPIPPHLHSSTAPHPHSPTPPHLHSPTAPQPHTSTAPQPHTPTPPHLHSPTAPQPHSPTPPQPHSPTAPHPHSPTAPQPHSPTVPPPAPAPQPLSPTVPQPHSPTIAPPHSPTAPRSLPESSSPTAPNSEDRRGSNRADRTATSLRSQPLARSERNRAIECATARSAQQGRPCWLRSLMFLVDRGSSKAPQLHIANVTKAHVLSRFSLVGPGTCESALRCVTPSQDLLVCLVGHADCTMKIAVAASNLMADHDLDCTLQGMALGAEGKQHFPRTREPGNSLGGLRTEGQCPIVSSSEEVLLRGPPNTVLSGVCVGGGRKTTHPALYVVSNPFPAVYELGQVPRSNNGEGGTMLSEETQTDTELKRKKDGEADTRRRVSHTERPREKQRTQTQMRTTRERERERERERGREREREREGGGGGQRERTVASVLTWGDDFAVGGLKAWVAMAAAFGAVIHGPAHGCQHCGLGADHM